jgi:hypothetical protein
MPKKPAKKKVKPKKRVFPKPEKGKPDFIRPDRASN